MKKRIVALLLCMVMVIGLFAGCNNNVPATTTDPINETTVPEGTTASNETTAQVSEEFDPRSITEGVKLTIAVPMDPNVVDYETNEMTRLIEERLGVDLEFEIYAASTYLEKLNVMVSGGSELPDIILGVTDESYKQWASEGALVDLAEYFENTDYAKSMHKFMEASGVDVLSLCRTLDGNIWAYPTLYTDADGMYAHNMYLNAEYAKAVGFDELPKTTDEFLALARAFKAAGDVNGNGEDDEVVMTGRADKLWWFKGLMNSFVYSWGYNYLLQNDGELKFAYTTDEWKEGLKYLRIFFEEGLIDTGALTNDKNTYKAIVNNDAGPQLADFFFWPEMSDMAKRNEYVKPIFLTSPVNDDVRSVYNPISPRNESFVTADCENPLAAFLVLDLIASHDEFSRINRCGTQGENWDYWNNITDEKLAELGYSRDNFIIHEGPADNGNFAYEWNSIISEPQNGGWNAKGPVLYHDIGTTVYYLTDNQDRYEVSMKRRQAVSISASDYSPMDLFVSALDVELTAEEIDEYADTIAALNSYISESMGAFLTGEWDIEEYWDTYIAELEKIGVNEMLEMYQTAFDRKTK